MSFFDKLNQFRDVKESVKENVAASDKSESNVSSPSFRFDHQPFDHQVNRNESFNLDPLSIKDLWQQAVEIHREKLSKPTTEEPVENVPNQEEEGVRESLNNDQEIPKVEDLALDSFAAEEPKDGYVLQTDLVEPGLEKTELPPVQAYSENQNIEEGLTHERFNSNEQCEMEDYEYEEFIQSLYDITPESLQENIDHAMVTVYTHLRQHAEEWFGLSLPVKELTVLKESKIGEAFQAITEVHSEQGYIYNHSIQAVQQLLPLLWKGSMEGDYQIPQSWYQTPLGYLFRYIQSGTRHHTFDPIDVSRVASMMNWTEKEVIERYPQLDGVKLDAGYVFSRQKVKEFMLTLKEKIPALSQENMEQFYLHTKEGLTRLMRIRQLMNEMYDELRYVRKLLLSGTDFVHNRIKKPVKMQIEQRLCDLYRKYKEMGEYSFSELQMNRKDFIGYTVPNVFQTLAQLGGTVINAENLARSLEESIQLVGEERAKLVQLTSELTTNLGQLSIEIELLSIKQQG